MFQQKIDLKEAEIIIPGRNEPIAVLKNCSIDSRVTPPKLNGYFISFHPDMMDMARRKPSKLLLRNKETGMEYVFLETTIESVDKDEIKITANEIAEQNPKYLRKPPALEPLE